MPHLPIPRLRSAAPASVTAAHRRLRRFVADHATGLRCAADLLGGHRHAAAVDEIVDRLRREPVPSRRTLRLLDDLLLLLSLEFVTDLDSPEAAAFSQIDPADPVVEEICLLTDGLRAALAGLAGLRAPSEAQAVAVPTGREAA